MLKKFIRAITILSVMVMLSVSFVFASSPLNTLHSFNATFTTSQETGPIIPSTPPNANASGHFDFDDQTHLLSFTITYNDLSDAPTMAHIHHGSLHENGPVAVMICSKSGTSILGSCPPANHGILAGQWLVPDDLVEELLNGHIYINFHTSLNPTGELRAQLQP